VTVKDKNIFRDSNYANLKYT